MSKKSSPVPRPAPCWYFWDRDGHRFGPYSDVTEIRAILSNHCVGKVFEPAVEGLAGILRAGQVAPRVITLENVKQIQQWGPLIAKRDKVTGRVIKLSGGVAEKGERVPLQNQFLIPDPKRAGQTWKAFVAQLQSFGYNVEWKVLCAADYGAPTTRERLFLVARRDGLPIVWPEPTHTKEKTKGKKKWRAASECIDWSLPCPSIFDREKPLAEATMRRIARGLKRYVLDAKKPFIVPIAHYHGHDTCHSTQEPLRTVTASTKGGTFAVSAPALAKLRGDSFGTRMDDPVPTITAGGNSKRPAGAPHALGVISPVMVQAGHGEGTPGRAQRWGSSAKDAQVPMGTVTASGGGGGKSAAVSAFLATNTTGHGGADCHGPVPTLTTGQQQACVQCTLSPDDERKALRVAAFLIRYYGEGGQLGDLHGPAATITTKERLALVTVHLQGVPYVITDIGLRMLQPRELYRAQGFPDDYIIDHGHDGRVFSKSNQVRFCGNSVSPPPAEALIRANYVDAGQLQQERVA